MAKSLIKTTIKKKFVQKRRFSTKIKFIRPLKDRKKSNISERKTDDSKSSNESSFISKKTESDFCLDLSLINWTSKFLNDNNINGKFIQNFLNIIKTLCFKKNEFVLWTIYIEYYIKNIQNLNDIFDIETLLYIGLFVKKIIGIKYNEDNNQNINKEKMSKINLILSAKNINIIELNKKYDYFNNSPKTKKHIKYDINSMVSFISESTPKTKIDKPNKTKIKAPVEKPKDINNPDKNDNIQNNYTLENRSCKLDDLFEDENNSLSRPEIDVFKGEIYGIDYYDNKELVESNEPNKLEYSYENLNMNLGGLFYIQNK